MSKKRPEDTHSSKIYRRCESAGVVFTEWLVRMSKKDLETNIPARFTGDVSQLEWCSQSC